MNQAQKNLIELLRDSEPPTAAEAAALHSLACALGSHESIIDLLDRYRVSRQTHESASEEAKAAKTEGKELWETLESLLNSGPDMFGAGGA